MSDFPRSLLEFQRRFPDAAACAAYLAAVRWPEGFVCPACGGRRACHLKTKAHTWQCSACHRQTYKSAWLLCAKLRRAMVDPSRSPLAGLVEADETMIPYRTKDDPPTGGVGRSGAGKMQVAAAVEVQGKGPGRIRLAVIPDASTASLRAFLRSGVAPGATLKTDGWSGYPGAPGIAHEPHVIGAMAAHVILPWVHRIFANLKTWALGVYHGLRGQHVDASVAARFARRPS